MLEDSNLAPETVQPPEDENGKRKERKKDEHECGTEKVGRAEGQGRLTPRDRDKQPCIDCAPQLPSGFSLEVASCLRSTMNRPRGRQGDSQTK